MPDNHSSAKPMSTGKIDIIPWSEAIGTYRDSMRQIVHARDLNPTHLPGWLDITIKSHGLPDPVDVVTLIANGDLCAAVPIFYHDSRSLGLSFKTIELVTNSVSYHADLIARDDLDDILAGVFETGHTWHIFRAANLALDGRAISSIQKYAADNGFATIVLPVEESPFLPITSDWDSFIASKNKKFRYKVRQREKAVTNDPSMSTVTVDADADVLRLHNEILDIESQSWKARYGLDIQTREKEREYYSLLLPYLAELGALHLDMLYYDDVAIAYSLCVNWRGWFGQLKTSFDERYSKLSPGAIVIDKSIKAAFNASAREFDFLGDMDRHKAAWTTHIRQHADIFIYNKKLRSQMLYLARQTRSRLRPRSRAASTKPKESD